MTSTEVAILEALERHTMRSGAQLAEATGIWSGYIYPALMRLERSGRITSEWQDSPYPRTLRYRLAEVTR